MVTTCDVLIILRTAFFATVVILVCRLFGVLDVNPVLGPVLVGVTGFLYLLAVVLGVLLLLPRPSF
jgi:hypothetical protein